MALFDGGMYAGGSKYFDEKTGKYSTPDGKPPGVSLGSMASGGYMTPTDKSGFNWGGTGTLGSPTGSVPGGTPIGGGGESAAGGFMQGGGTKPAGGFGSLTDQGGGSWALGGMPKYGAGTADTAGFDQLAAAQAARQGPAAQSGPGSFGQYGSMPEQQQFLLSHYLGDRGLTDALRNKYGAGYNDMVNKYEAGGTGYNKQQSDWAQQYAIAQGGGPAAAFNAGLLKGSPYESMLGGGSPPVVSDPAGPSSGLGGAATGQPMTPAGPAAATGQPMAPAMGADKFAQGGSVAPYTFGGGDGYKFGQGNYADPGYNFRLNEGMNALQGSAAARGGLLSGATLKGISNYAQNSASQEFGNAYNRFNQDRNFNYNVDNNDRQFGYNAARDDRDFNYRAQTGDRDFGYNAARDDRNFNQQSLRDLMSYGMQGTQGQGDTSRLLATLLGQNALTMGQTQAAGGLGQSGAINGAISQLLQQFLNNQHQG